MKENKTYFASPDRSDISSIQDDKNKLMDINYLASIMNALPDIAAILDENRQIVFCNQPLLDLLGSKDMEEILGSRPGEAVHCKHSSEMEAGCGTSESCRYCGAVNAIVESQKTKESITKECRITSSINNTDEHFDLRVTASPFHYQDTDYTIFSIKDISDEKRRRALERIFFHDVINTAGGIQGFISFLKDTDNDDERQQYIEIADRLSHDLLDEIQAQRALSAAETGELITDYIEVQSLGIIEDVVYNLKFHEVANNKSIAIDPDSAKTVFHSDKLVLKRVIINMLKNALEASPDGSVVTVGCTKIPLSVIFWVKNDSFIPKDIQLQIFKRSFSTKGANRGLGTYSIKLLTEKYLDGIVYFETSKEKGTIFSARIPV